MPPLKICRICLGTEVKLYKYDSYRLREYYEQIMASKIDEEEIYSLYFCYECAALLHKFHKFKEKCYKGEKVLKELNRRGPITIKVIHNLDRQTNNLQSSLNLITINRRVKTYVIKSKAKPKLIKDEEPTDDDLEPVPTTTYDDNSVNDYSDIEEVPPLPELIDVDEKIDDGVEQIEVVKEETIEDTKIPLPEEVTEFVKEFIDEVFNNDVNMPIDDTPIESTVKKEEVVTKKKKHTKVIKKKNKRKKVNKTDNKAKKFEITDKKKTELDCNNWLKYNLSEEEAIEEFNARAQHKRFISAEYKCHDCFKGFSKEDMLNRHVKLRHSESVGPIECRFCHMRFKWKCFLRKHMRQHYTKFKCLRCDLVCPLETTALFHEEYHNGVIRKCAHCGEEFKHQTTYYTHLRTHRSEHVCTRCGASFVSAVGLRIHKKIKHIENSEPEITEGTGDEKEYCSRCDIRFETKKAYEEHLIHSAMHVDGIEDLEVDAPSGVTRNPKKRRQHLKRLTRIPTDCHLCGKHFATQAACRKHHLAEHPGTSFFASNERQICEICGISLAPGSVTSHLNTHTREKLHTCSTCGRQFSSKGGMTTHLLTHTSEKPVACTLCDKRFKQLSSMKLHYRTFHLKEPYPKRNRKKKIDELTKLDEYPHEESDENITIDRWR